MSGNILSDKWDYSKAGGRGGIRTLETLRPTRFPSARTRPGYATLPRIGTLERTRTSDLQVRNLTFYPLNYEGV